MILIGFHNGLTVFWLQFTEFLKEFKSLKDAKKLLEDEKGGFTAEKTALKSEVGFLIDVFAVIVSN